MSLKGILKLFNSSNASCNNSCDGNATVIPSGGTIPYTYLWNNGQTSSSLTGVSVGTYTCVVADDTLCTTTQSVTIYEPTPLTATLISTDSVNCNGGSDGGAEIIAIGSTPSYSYT